ncbi:MAG TPA: hypothetical protein VFP86_12690 [bacterium]|nr:hypothetical protein [bacterium]
MRRPWQSLIPALIVGLGFIPWAAGQGNGQGATSALALEPATLTVDQGGTASAKVTVALRSGKTGGTSLMAWDVPSGMTIQFSPVTGNPPFTATLSVGVTSTAKPGTFIVKLQATGADPSVVVSYPVIVQRTAGGGY